MVEDLGMSPFPKVGNVTAYSSLEGSDQRRKHHEDHGFHDDGGDDKK